MHMISISPTFDAASGTFRFDMDFQGGTEMEHEILAALFASPRTVRIMPTHKRDELFATFSIVDGAVFARATRAHENRIRERDGRLSVEEEQAAIEKAMDEKKARKDKA